MVVQICAYFPEKRAIAAPGLATRLGERATACSPASEPAQHPPHVREPNTLIHHLADGRRDKRPAKACSNVSVCYQVDSSHVAIPEFFPICVSHAEDNLVSDGGPGAVQSRAFSLPSTHDSQLGAPAWFPQITSRRHWGPGPDKPGCLHTFQETAQHSTGLRLPQFHTECPTRQSHMKKPLFHGITGLPPWRDTRLLARYGAAARSQCRTFACRCFLLSRRNSIPLLCTDFALTLH